MIWSDCQKGLIKFQTVRQYNNSTDLDIREARQKHEDSSWLSWLHVELKVSQTIGNCLCRSRAFRTVIPLESKNKAVLCQTEVSNSLKHFFMLRRDHVIDEGFISLVEMKDCIYILAVRSCTVQY